MSETEQGMQMGGYPMPFSIHGGSMVAMTNVDKEMTELKLHLEGKAFNEETGEYEQIGEPLLNERGVKRVMAIARSMINTMAIMGDIQKNEVNKLLMFAVEPLRLDLMLNGRARYDMNDYSKHSMVMRLVTTMAFINLTRAREGSDKRFWKSTQQDIHTSVTGPKKAPGLLGKLWGGG